MRKIVLESNHDQVLIGSPAEATKLVLKIENVVTKLFKSMSLGILSKAMACLLAVNMEQQPGSDLGVKNYIPLGEQKNK